MRTRSSTQLDAANNPAENRNAIPQGKRLASSSQAGAAKRRKALAPITNQNGGKVNP